MTNDDIDDWKNTAQNLALELNELLRHGNVRKLYDKRQIDFTHHPYVATGQLGEEYKKGTEEWLKNGAFDELLYKLDAKPHFSVGNLGSVWLDLYLTGGTGDYRRVNKKCRVTPMRRPDGGFDLMLDNTFDEEW